MANILDRYGIKEVADVTFYKINKDGTPGVPVLFLDTLKVSTIEQTAENTSARGGKGNPELIMWDYGKEITVNLEDALFSAKSLAMMYGVDTEGDDFGEISELLKTVPAGAIKEYNAEKGTATFIINEQHCAATDVVLYDAEGNKLTSAEDVAKTKYATGTIEVVGQKIDISSDKFPGTYYVIGDTYARSETTGQDEFFQFIIPKAKMQSEVTLTMEAEGDPSTFNMNMKVLRPANGEMMKLVKFRLPVVIATGVAGVGEYDDDTGNYILGDNVTWSLNDAGVLTFSGSGKMGDFEDVPKDNYWVAEHRDSVEKAVVEEGVTNLGYMVLKDHKNLQSLKLSKTVTNIDGESLNGCENLTEVYILGPVELDPDDFSTCPKLTTLTLSGDVTDSNRDNWDDTLIEKLIYTDGVIKSLSINDFVSEVECLDEVTGIADKAFSWGLLHKISLG